MAMIQYRIAVYDFEFMIKGMEFQMLSTYVHVHVCVIFVIV